MDKPNTYYINLRGKANIPIPLGIGHNFRLTADCSITEEKKVDNEDGSFDVIYKAEPITVEIGKDNGPTIKAKDPRRNSQKIRNYCYKIFFDEGIVEDFDKVYDAVTTEILMRMPELVKAGVSRLGK